MSRKSSKFSDFLVECVVVLIGWAFCINVLVGAYLLGWWIAPLVGWTGDREILGLLSAITLIWIYEHRHFEEKLNSLYER